MAILTKLIEILVKHRYKHSVYFAYNDGKEIRYFLFDDVKIGKIEYYTVLNNYKISKTEHDIYDEYCSRLDVLIKKYAKRNIYISFS